MLDSLMTLMKASLVSSTAVMVGSFLMDFACSCSFSCCCCCCCDWVSSISLFDVSSVCLISCIAVKKLKFILTSSSCLSGSVLSTLTSSCIFVYSIPFCNRSTRQPNGTCGAYCWSRVCTCDSSSSAYADTSRPDSCR